jgi:hypothetical protein
MQIIKQKSKKPKLTRQDKALVLVDSVGKKDDTSYLVQSQSDVNKVYEVVFLYGRKSGCQCDDFRRRNGVESCKHILAVQEFMKREKKEQEDQKKDELAKIVKESENAQRKGREELTAQYTTDESDGWYTGPEPEVAEEELEEAGF